MFTHVKSFYNIHMYITEPDILIKQHIPSYFRSSEPTGSGTRPWKEAAVTVKLSVSKHSQGAYCAVGTDWSTFPGLREFTMGVGDKHSLRVS